MEQETAVATISKAILINAPDTEVFRLITDPERVAPFIPGLIHIQDVPPLPMKPGSTYHWEYQFLGMPFRGKWIVEEIRPPHLYIGQSEGGISSRWMYTLVPKGPMTVLTLDIDYGPPSSLLKRYMQSFVEPHTDKLAETYLQSLKTYLETDRVQEETPQRNEFSSL